jgi:hypothetical protein
VRLRTGRRNPRAIYLQRGDEPADTDPCAGLMLDPAVAMVIVETVNLADKYWHDLKELDRA